MSRRGGGWWRRDAYRGRIDQAAGEDAACDRQSDHQPKEVNSATLRQKGAGALVPRSGASPLAGPEGVGQRSVDAVEVSLRFLFHCPDLLDFRAKACL